MNKTRRKYRVYLSSKSAGVYGSRTVRTFLGETAAVSAAQAVNNVRYQMDGKRPNAWIAGDYAGEGSNYFSYEAEEV